jgi:uncharacterized protein
MSQSSDVEIVERIYRALAERDLESLFDLYDDECVITQDERLPWGGRHEGHDGLVTFAAALTGAIDSAVEMGALFEADGTVVQFGWTRGKVRSTGVPFDIPEVHRWTLRDGRVVAVHHSIDTPAMLNALGAAAG